MHTTIEQIRNLRTQLKSLEGRFPNEERFNALRERVKTIQTTLTEIEEALYQTQNRAPQDPLNFPVRLNDQLGHVMEVAAVGDFPPTTQAVQVKDMLFEKTNAVLTRWQQVRDSDLPALNRMMRQLEFDVIGVN